MKCIRNCEYSVGGTCKYLEWSRLGAEAVKYPTACESPAKVAYGLETNGIEPAKNKKEDE